MHRIHRTKKDDNLDMTDGDAGSTDGVTSELRGSCNH